MCSTKNLSCLLACCSVMEWDCGVMKINFTSVILSVIDSRLCHQFRCRGLNTIQRHRHKEKVLSYNNVNWSILCRKSTGLTHAMQEKLGSQLVLDETLRKTIPSYRQTLNLNLFVDKSFIFMKLFVLFCFSRHHAQLIHYLSSIRWNFFHLLFNNASLF